MRTLRRMIAHKSADTRFTLSARAAGVSVDVHLRGAGERWAAVALIDGRRDVGIGSKPAVALTAALASLDNAVRVALLADLALLRPSCEILEVLPAG